MASNDVRYNVRLLQPDDADELRIAVATLGAPSSALPLLARHAAVEVIALEGLRHDETRVLERNVQRAGGAVITNAEGSAALVLASLETVAALPPALREWGEATEGLADELSAVLMARGTRLQALIGDTWEVALGDHTAVIATTGSADIRDVSDQGANADSAGHEGDLPLCVASPDATSAAPVALRRGDDAALSGAQAADATTAASLLVVPAVMAIADACRSAREIRARTQRAVWVELDVTRQLRGRVVQLRSAGIPVVAALPSGGDEVVAAVVAQCAGVNAVRCRDGDAVAAALTTADRISLR